MTIDQFRPVLVTGATGTVGREIVRQLIDEGVPVRAFVRDPDTAGLPPEAEVVRGDLTDPVTLREAVDGIRAAFLIWPFHNPAGVREVLELLEGAWVVYLSSAAVRDSEPEQTDPNAALHHAVEQEVTASGLVWTILRPYVFAANTLRWIPQVRGGIVREPFGAAAMSLLHQADLAAVAVRALVDNDHGGRTYEITGAAPLTKIEQVQIIGEVTGIPVRFEETDREDVREAMLNDGWPPGIVEGVLDAQAAMVDAPRPITSTVEEITGASARGFREWVADHANLFTRDDQEATR